MAGREHPGPAPLARLAPRIVFLIPPPASIANRERAPQLRSRQDAGARRDHNPVPPAPCDRVLRPGADVCASTEQNGAGWARVTARDGPTAADRRPRLPVHPVRERVPPLAAGRDAARAQGPVRSAVRRSAGILRGSAILMHRVNGPNTRYTGPRHCAGPSAGLSRGLLRAHRNPTSPRHGGRPQRNPTDETAHRYTCDAC
jgi:hypothetical protein